MFNFNAEMPDPPLTSQFSKFSVTHAILEQGASKEEKKDSNGAKAGEVTQQIEQKDFFWDHLLFYIGSAILALTALDISVEFLRGSRGVICFTPYEDGNFTRDQAAFVNSYCSQSLPLTEYFPIFIIVQGILLLAPHYLWESLFRGYFDSFFGLVKQLDRLRDPKTGEYADRNINIVNKLEAEFSSNQRRIFIYYILKLLFQMLIALLSVALSESVFLDFSTSFSCPHAEIPPDWPLDSNVTCVFSSLRILFVIRYGDYALIAIGVCAGIYGLLWCVGRHVTELGYRDIAKFAYTSGLSPECFVPPSPLKCLHRTCIERVGTIFSPGIRNDLDFILMRLFRADAGIGQAFKDIQIHKELKRHLDQDHELLHVFIDAQQDELHKNWPKTPNNEQTQLREKRNDICDYFWGAGYAHGTEFRPFDEKINENPEYNSKFQQHFSHRMGNVNLVHHPSIRDRFYAFVGLSGRNDKALDIGFGSPGYVLELARAFRSVIAVNFHPFYRNEEEICRKQEYNTNFCTIRVVDDLYTKNSHNVIQFEEKIDVEFCGKQFPEEDPIDYKEERKQINFIVVGPIADPAKKITVNVVLEQFHSPNPPYIADNAILLAIRPLSIEHKDVRTLYHKYEPPEGLFDHKYHGEKVQTQLVNLKGRVKLQKVGDCEGIPVKCGNTYCVFEFVTYRYYRGTSRCEGTHHATGHGTGVRREPELMKITTT